ncbi:hypothetical protein Gohar_000826 [Gossypium harknessii]|uniref:Uncharacterized protein n=1 Tax=Gossypium harknessii TaxID=34285 RepID=A0A7J9I1Z8_9ROSI|nr:hypothetical protein [Gossypium harknessii]
MMFTLMETVKKEKQLRYQLYILKLKGRILKANWRGCKIVQSNRKIMQCN